MVLRLLAETDDHGDDHHGSHHHVSRHDFKMYSTGVVVLALLVLLSIVFTNARDWVNTHTHATFMPVVTSAFSELMVLGFVAVCLFVALELPGIEKLSRDIFDDDDEIEHIAHVLHMCLFLVMVVYILQLALFVAAASARARRLRRLEADCFDLREIQDRYVASLANPSYFNRAKERLQYAAIRHAFTTPGDDEERSFKSLDDVEDSLETRPNFDFARYLLIIMGNETAKLIELTLSTWCSLLVVLLVAWVYLVEWKPSWDHDVGLVIFQLILWSVIVAIYLKLRFIKDQVTPTCFFDEAHKRAGAPSAPDASNERDLAHTLGSHRAQSTYVSQRNGAIYTVDACPPPHAASADEHKSLFWFGVPEIIPWVVRLVLFVQAIIVSSSWFVMSRWHLPEQAGKMVLLFFVCTVLPAIVIAYFATSIIEHYALVTSIAPLKKPLVIARVARRQKLIRSFRSLQLGAIVLMSKNDGEVKDAEPNPEADQALVASLSPKQYLEQLELFAVFDENRDGKVSRQEIESFIAKVSFAVSTEAAATYQAVRDAFGSQPVSFVAFAAWLVRISPKSRDADIHDLMFQLLDESRDGYVTLAELVKMMAMIGHHFEIDELQLSLMDYDDSGDGRLDRAEFARLCNHVGVI